MKRKLSKDSSPPSLQRHFFCDPFPLSLHADALTIAVVSQKVISYATNSYGQRATLLSRTSLSRPRFRLQMFPPFSSVDIAPAFPLLFRVPASVEATKVYPPPFCGMQN